jgi:hypothetical protein
MNKSKNQKETVDCGGFCRLLLEKKVVGLENELLALVKEKITLNEVCDDLKVCLFFFSSFRCSMLRVGWRRKKKRLQRSKRPTRKTLHRVSVP